MQFGSSQYSPRLTRYLLQDYVVRNALGVFSATFLYALFAIVELGLPGEAVDPAIPTAVALLLLIASLGMFLALLGRVRACRYRASCGWSAALGGR